MIPVTINLNGILKLLVLAVVKLNDLVVRQVVHIVVVGARLHIHTVVLMHIVLIASSAVRIAVVVFKTAIADMSVFLSARPVAVIVGCAVTAVVAVEVVIALVSGTPASLIADVLAIAVNYNVHIAADNADTLLVAVKVWCKEVIACLVVRQLLAITPVA